MKAYFHVNKRGEVKRFVCGGDCGNSSSIVSGTINYD